MLPYSPDSFYDRPIGYIPPLADTRVDPLPDPPPRAPRLDLAEMPPGALDPSGLYHRYSTRRAPRWYSRSPNLTSRRSRKRHEIYDLKTYQPTHLILTLEASDILRIGNAPLATTQRTLRAAMPPLWPLGVSKDKTKQTEWVMKFKGRPWTDTGMHFLDARRMLCRVFKCLANTGWSYVNAVHTHRAPIRHIFELAPADVDSEFMAVSMSASRRTLYIVDCSQDVAQALIRAVRNLYTPDIVREGWQSHGVFCLRIQRQDFFRRDEDLAIFLALVMKGAAERGYRLDANVPLARSGVFGLGRRREVWIYKRIMPVVL